MLLFLQLRLLDMSLSGHYQCLLECDVWREMEKHLDTQAPSGGEDTDHGGVVECVCVCVCVCVRESYTRLYLGFKVIESRFPWKQPGSCDSKVTPTTSTELGTALLGIHYWHTHQQPASSHIRYKHTHTLPWPATGRHECCLALHAFCQ